MIRHAPVLSIAAFFAIICLVFTFSTSAFASNINLLNLLRPSAPILIVATAMTFVITTGGIDLSVGSTLALVNALAAITLQAEVPWPAVVVLMLGVGAIIGLINGYFTAYEGIPAFIVTLATLSAVRGLALLLTKGFSIPIASDILFVQIGRRWIFGVPFPAIIAAIVLVAGYVLLTRTPYGQYITGIGANAEAVRRAGVNVRLYTMSVYIMSGVAAAIGGIIIAARLGSGSSNAAVGFELEVIAAVVLGGTYLFGGRGTIIGTLLGALTIAVIGNGLMLAKISPYLYPDRNRRHHSGGHLAQHASLPDRPADTEVGMQNGAKAIESGFVTTVAGPIPVDRLGVTMMHEHIVVDATSWWHCPDCAERMFLTDKPVRMGILGELRMDPFVNRDNCTLADVDLAVAELGQFADLGGRTIVDSTNRGMGRSPLTLRRISERTGLNVVMGAGYYLGASHPERLTDMTRHDIADEIEPEATDGIADSGVRIGIIGEIGIS